LFLFQLQRNILATCPRVTRFKIDWGDTEDSENLPPPSNTENESNQMAVDMEGLSKPTDRLEAAMKGQVAGNNGCAPGLVLSGSSTDIGLSGSIGASSTTMDTEPMQM
jgi:hypothetical protein